jgi:8-amino-7-oxononanoate synthase
VPEKCTDNPQLSLRLFELIDALHTELQRIRAPNDLLTIPLECPKSPIFALLTPHPRELAKYCQDAGFVVRAVVPPTVPKGTERVRVCLHAGNTEAEISSLVDRVQEWVDDRSAVVSASTDSTSQLVAKL